LLPLFGEGCRQFFSKARIYPYRRKCVKMLLEKEGVSAPQCAGTLSLPQGLFIYNYFSDAHTVIRPHLQQVHALCNIAGIPYNTVAAGSFMAVFQ